MSALGGGDPPADATARLLAAVFERSPRTLTELAQPSLRRLAGESGETANLFLPRPSGSEAIAQVDGIHLLGATNWIGRELGLHCTASGKVFLAFGAAELGPGGLEAGPGALEPARLRRSTRRVPRRPAAGGRPA